MLSADNSALVAGAVPAAPATTVTVRILRAVMVDGCCVDVGREVTVDKYLAAQLLTSGKAERVPAPAAATALPAAPTPETKPAAKAVKEKTRAQQ